MTWIPVGKLGEIEKEGAIRFDHSGRTYAIYRGPDDSVYCTAGLCTHEAVHLADGLITDFEVECPKHSATFDYRTGEALRLPACENLKVYPAKVIGDEVLVDFA